MNIRVVEAAQLPVVSLDDMKLHLRVDHDDEDSLIDVLTTAAASWVADYVGRSLVETTLEVSLDCYPSDLSIWLPRPPLIEVESFTYVDSDGVDQVLADDQYVVDVSSDLAPRVIPTYGISWPVMRYQSAALRVRYTAGYARPGSPDERGLIPAPLVSAVKLLVGHFYRNREAVGDNKLVELPMSVESLCRPFRTSVGL